MSKKMDHVLDALLLARTKTVIDLRDTKHKLSQLEAQYVVIEEDLLETKDAIGYLVLRQEMLEAEIEARKT